MSSTSDRGARPRTRPLPFRDGRVDPTATTALAHFHDIANGAELPPVEAAASEPFTGITTDGTVVPGLFSLADEGLDTRQVVTAADDYLASLTPDQRSRAVLPVDAPEWRLWINAFLTFPEHGLLLDTLSSTQRDAALSLIATTLSAAGWRDIRTAMRLNAELGDLCPGYEDTLREYKYWLTLFGSPSVDEPWGWQLMGHHIDVHCLVVGRQLVLTPTFLGTELDGHTLFADHMRRGIALMDSLTPAQHATTVLYPSMRTADLPPPLAGALDGRHRAGAGRDNRVIPYEGIPAHNLTRGQRQLLLELIQPYLHALPTGPYQAKLAHVERHLDETRFAWIGSWDDGEPFYYKIHSPVILIEYDNHSGIFLDNPEPEPFHVHTIVRTPNGNDYGKDLLRQHYARFH